MEHLLIPPKKENDMSSITENAADLEKLLETLNKRAEESENILSEDFIEDLTAPLEEYQSYLKGDIEEINNELSEIEEERDDYIKETEVLEEKISDLEDNIKELVEERNNYKEKYEELKESINNRAVNNDHYNNSIYLQ
jgi:chromosome segregation ATPase